MTNSMPNVEEDVAAGILHAGEPIGVGHNPDHSGPTLVDVANFSYGVQPGGDSSEVKLRPALVGEAGKRIEKLLSLDTVGRPYKAVASVLQDQLREASTSTEDSLIGDALAQSAAKERISETLLRDLVKARRSDEREAANRAALGKILASHAQANTARLSECDDELEAELKRILDEILADADRAFGALHRAGVTTAEGAIRVGLGAEWLAQAGLPARWLDAQRARVWLAFAGENGFGDIRHGHTDDPTRIGSGAQAHITDWSEWWARQFATTTEFSVYDSAADILSWWVSQPENLRPDPLTN